MTSEAVLAADGAPARDPIIVTGAPRTGVRLMAAILDGHPALATGPDLPFVASLVQQWHEIDRNLGVNHERNHRVPPDASRAAFREAALKLFAPRLQRTGKQCFVLQTFTATVLLDQFAAVFPAARFILMIRDPRDVVRSLLRCNWRDTRTGQALACTRDPVAASRFLLEVLVPALRSARALQAAGRLMQLPYESLCSDPYRTMASLGTFLQESPPRPWVLADSAVLVAESADNPHPPLRAGAVAATDRRGSRVPLDFGQMTEPMERLCRAFGYADDHTAAAAPR